MDTTGEKFTEGKDTSDLYRQLSEDIGKTIENHLSKPVAGELSTKGSQTRKTTKGEVSGGLDGSVKSNISEVIRALQTVLIQCVTTAVCKASSTVSKELIEDMKSQYMDNSTTGDLRNHIKLQIYQLDRMEQYNRRENLRIKDIEDEEEDTSDVGVRLFREDVSATEWEGSTKEFPDQ